MDPRFSENLWTPYVHQSELEFHIKSVIKSDASASSQVLGYVHTEWESIRVRRPKVLERDGFFLRFRVVNIARNKEILNANKMR